MSFVLRRDWRWFLLSGGAPIESGIRYTQSTAEDLVRLTKLTIGGFKFLLCYFYFNSCTDGILLFMHLCFYYLQGGNEYRASFDAPAAGSWTIFFITVGA